MHACFQNLQNLVILDLGGNPVAVTADNYRLFVIYHLKCLKALDGKAIVSIHYINHNALARKVSYCNYYSDDMYSNDDGGVMRRWKVMMIMIIIITKDISNVILVNLTCDAIFLVGLFYQ